MGEGGKGGETLKAALVALGVIALAGMAWLTFVPQTVSNLLIENPTAKPMGDMIGVELRINNQGIPDRLVSVTSGDSVAMIQHPHESRDLPIPVGQSSLSIDAAHIMLSVKDLELPQGTLFPLTLSFEKAGDVAIKARLNNSEEGMLAGHSISLTEPNNPVPRIAIAAVADGPGWLVNIAVDNFTLSKEQVGGPHVPGVGYGHIYAGGMKLGRVYAPTFRIGALPKGTHEIRVTLNSNDHRIYMQGDSPITAMTVITVD